MIHKTILFTIYMTYAYYLNISLSTMLKHL